MDIEFVGAQPIQHRLGTAMVCPIVHHSGAIRYASDRDRRQQLVFYTPKRATLYPTCRKQIPKIFFQIGQYIQVGHAASFSASAALGRVLDADLQTQTVVCQYFRPLADRVVNLQGESSLSHRYYATPLMFKAPMRNILYREPKERVVVTHFLPEPALSDTELYGVLPPFYEKDHLLKVENREGAAISIDPSLGILFQDKKPATVTNPGMTPEKAEGLVVGINFALDGIMELKLIPPHIELQLKAICKRIDTRVNSSLDKLLKKPKHKKKRIRLSHINM